MTTKVESCLVSPEFNFDRILTKDKVVKISESKQLQRFAAICQSGLSLERLLPIDGPSLHCLSLVPQLPVKGGNATVAVKRKQLPNVTNAKMC